MVKLYFIGFILRRKVARITKKINKEELQKIIYLNPTFDEETSIYTLNAQNSITCNYDGCGCYLIFNSDHKVLYVGKDEKLPGRLSKHLISNPNLNGTNSHTGSKINKVYDYLITNNKDFIEYRIIPVKPWFLYEAVEHLLIEYYKAKGEAEWNEQK